ncbi:hypothetical protein DAPPUDRAFT_109414 [Daphnia pulex]|uniref:AB hydrolase-1 domain-containing protein n=1 Tax=Daphnia pulex TaxID=6669 RepID=E9H301_DAPPU|nr:hypothetical protein DAPPUDRAFT_109414 [Daphnia pulex]|eukprot:EFX73873.1 hypothetical protein DAPPUDRAFT_109414 [Daphnia pulex]
MERRRQSYWYTGFGFGFSSRPNFSSAAQEAEAQLVKSIELLANALGLVDFILLGHSMGGFLVSAYALQHPDRVSHLVLADPWGFPNPTDQPGNDPAQLPTPFWWNYLDILHRYANPLFLIRAFGPLGLFAVKYCGRYLFPKFVGAVENTVETISQYVYQCNAQIPTGKLAFHCMMVNSDYARFLMVNRLLPLKHENPITFIYGWNSWIDRQPGLIIKEYRNQSTVDLLFLVAPVIKSILWTELFSKKFQVPMCVLSYQGL